MTAPMTDADLAAMERWCRDEIAEVDAALREAAEDPCGGMDPRDEGACADSKHRAAQVIALVAEQRRLRGMLRDYANACDAIDATVGIEAPETWEPAQRAFDAARDALYAEGKR